MQNILLLGGTGYIGRHLLPLIASTNKVTLLTRDFTHCAFIDTFPELIKKNIHIADLLNLNTTYTNAEGGMTGL